MFELQIDDYEEATWCITTGWPTRIISLVPMDSYGPHHLVVDTDDPAGHAVEHLDRVLAYTRTLIDTDRLLVHCAGGISRSPAMAIAICVQHGMSPTMAFYHVRQLRPEAEPNAAILEAADKHFRFGGRLAALGR